MKTSSVEGEEITDKFNELAESYNEYLKAENEWVEQWRKPVKKIQKDYIESGNMILNQLALAKWEMKLEKRLQKGRKKWTSDFFAGSKEAVKSNMKLAKETARESNKIMRQASKGR